MKIRWTKIAETRLLNRTEYIREDNPEIARQVITTIRNVANRLSKHPYIFPPHNEFPGFREADVPHSSFVIWYRIKEKEQVVEIVTVWHAAQDQTDAF